MHFWTIINNEVATTKHGGVVKLKIAITLTMIAHTYNSYYIFGNILTLYT